MNKTTILKVYCVKCKKTFLTTIAEKKPICAHEDSLRITMPVSYFRFLQRSLKI